MSISNETSFRLKLILFLVMLSAMGNSSFVMIFWLVGLSNPRGTSLEPKFYHSHYRVSISSAETFSVTGGCVRGYQ